LICHWSKPSTLLHVYLFLSKLLESCFTRSIIRDGFAKHVCQPRRQDLAPPRRELQQSMSQMASSNWCRRQESLSRDSVDEDAAAAAYASACREVGRDPAGRKGSSQYRGVSRSGAGCWQAAIRVRGCARQHLGCFGSELEAARAYDAAARAQGVGERANFPTPPVVSAHASGGAAETVEGLRGLKAHWFSSFLC
jgi:hypothetical protein